MKRVIKYIASAIFILAIFYSFSACSESQKNQEGRNQESKIERPDQTEIKMVGQWLGQGDREKFIREFVREYNFLHQDQKVTMVFSENLVGNDRGGQKLDQWTAKQLKSEQSEYDLLMLNNLNNIILEEPDWAEKYLVDFSEIEGFEENTVEGVIEKNKERWSGIIPGPFIEGFNYALWCNLDVANKLGIEVKQTGMTFEDFKNYLKVMDEYNQQASEEDQIYGILEAGDWSTMVFLFNQLFLSNLESDKHYHNKYISESKLEAWHKTLKQLEQIAPYNPLPPDWESNVWNDIFPEMLSDKYLFFSNATWMFNFWQSVDKEKLRKMMPAEYPVSRPVNHYIGGYQIMWVVPKNAQHPKAAIDFLMAMNQPKVADKWVRYAKSPTGIKAELASSSMGGDQFENFINAIDQKYGENKITLGGNNQYIFDAERRFSENYGHEVMTGKMTADEAMKQIRDSFRNQSVRIVQE
jgi:ABC-type glycerol-3-phosphate transport system substrate-binding protein